MSETSNQDHRLASEDRVSVVPGDGREETDPQTGGSSQPVVQVSNPPKDPERDDQ